MSYFTETLEETMSILERGSAKQQKQRTKDLIAQDRADGKRQVMKDRAKYMLRNDDHEHKIDAAYYDEMRERKGGKGLSGLTAWRNERW